jgi:hypothetical protein
MKNVLRSTAFVASIMLLAVLLVAAGSPAKSRMRPWNGVWNGDATIVGKCDNNGLSFVENGTGYMEQMGKTKWSNEYCMDPETWTGSGTATETAANGDKIFVQTTPQFTWTSPTSGTWVETEVVTGGAGRFAGATGSSHSKGTFTLTSQTTADWGGTTTGMLCVPSPDSPCPTNCAP